MNLKVELKKNKKKQYGGGGREIWNGGQHSGLNGYLLLRNLFVWAQDWRTSDLYSVYTGIGVILLLFCYNECYQPNYFFKEYSVTPLSSKTGEINQHIINDT